MKVSLRHPELPYQVAITLLSICLVALAFALLHIGLMDYQKYQAFSRRESIYREQLQTLEAQEAAQTAYLSEMIENPAFREHVVRENLNYARDGEIVIRFEESYPAEADQ